MRIWRLGYHDHLCLSRETIDSTEHYIANNPLKWWLMHCDRTLMRVREPLDSPLLDPTGIFWRGVGNTGLIDPPVPGSTRHLVAMRISQLLILAAMGSPSTPSSRFELLECNRQAGTIARAAPGGRAVYAIPAGGGVSYTPV